MKAKVFVFLFCFLFLFTIFLTNVSAVTIEDLYSKDNVFTVKNLTTGETKEVTIPKFTKGDFSKATNYVLVYKNENDYFFQFTSDNKNYIVVYSNISGGYEIRRNGTYQVIGSDVYYQDLGDYYLSSSGNLYGENVYIYSTCDLYKVIDRDEAMQEDLPENAELITSGSLGNYEVDYGTDVSLDDLDKSYFEGYKYIYAYYDNSYVVVYGFNNLDCMEYEYKNGLLQPIFEGDSNNKVISVTYSRNPIKYFSKNVLDTLAFMTVPRVGYNNNNAKLLYNNFDIIYNDVLIASSMDINSYLKLEYEYNEDYTKATIYAILEDGKYDDYIYYSLNGEDWIYKENTFTVEVTYNTEVFFKVEDKNGNIKSTNSVVIDKIKSLSDINFNVTFDFTPTNGSFMFTPILKSNLDRIFFKPIGDLSDFKITELNSNDVVDTEEYIELKNGVTYVVKETKYNIINGFLGGATNINPINLTLSFKILNPQNEEVYTKNYDCILHPYKNSSISGSGVEDINVDWSFSSAVDNIKAFFETSKEFFNLLLQFISDLPMWIVSPLYTLLIFAVILFVYHLLRG